MSTFQVILKLTVQSKDVVDIRSALDWGHAAWQHLHDTFNDDESLQGSWNVFASEADKNEKAQNKAFEVTMTSTISSDDVTEPRHALDWSQAACMHLYETFNDDNSLLDEWSITVNEDREGATGDLFEDQKLISGARPANRPESP